MNAHVASENFCCNKLVAKCSANQINRLKLYVYIYIYIYMEVFVGNLKAHHNQNVNSNFACINGLGN
jgi:hypothetical protein